MNAFIILIILLLLLFFSLLFSTNNVSSSIVFTFVSKINAWSRHGIIQSYEFIHLQVDTRILMPACEFKKYNNGSQSCSNNIYNKCFKYSFRPHTYIFHDDRSLLPLQYSRPKARRRSKIRPVFLASKVLKRVISKCLIE